MEETLTGLDETPEEVLLEKENIKYRNFPTRGSSRESLGKSDEAPDKAPDEVWGRRKEKLGMKS